MVTVCQPWKLVVLPIAVHLLVRQHSRTQLYPSLRFLRETQLAAFRRRKVEADERD